jgi:predicted ATPase/DNA-binding CsgD family transcriptional regulator
MGDRALGPRASGLPAELTSFVGRRQELREVKRLLAANRLLTLTGSGGAGKTRLAVWAAAGMARGFPDGAWLVSLGSVHDPLLVTQAVFGALRVHDLSAGLSLSSLTEYLARRRLLLVLDNCEHLLDGCAVLAGTLLTSCPGLRVLATSRQALGVAGEVRVVVPPMSLPEAGDDISVRQALDCDAVWLLSERAAAVVPGFAVGPGNAAGVVELCRRLDGIPLALELAAVRLGSLSLEQLNEGLASELSILGTANRGAEARQQTLEATIGWSYGLLGEQERLLWARLSVFAGGFEADAAADVCSDPQLPVDRIVAVLGELVEKSILKRQLKGDRPPRYWLLETLRWYGRQRLDELGEKATAQKRHFAWMCGLGKMAGAADGRQAEAFGRMADERDNLWAALDFCLRHPGEVEAGADLAQHLMAFWACRGPIGDVRRVLASLIEVASEGSAPRGRLLWVAAAMAVTQNDYEAAAALGEESLRIGTLLKDVHIVGWSLIYLTIAYWFAGNPPEAARLNQVLSLARLMQLPQLELAALDVLANTSMARGELDRVVEFGDQGLANSKARGELWHRAFLLNVMSQAIWLRGDRQRAEALAREGASCNHALDDRAGLAILLETLAWMAAEEAGHERSAVLLGFAQRVRETSALTLVEPFQPQHAQSVAAAVQGLGQAAFDASFDRGRVMTIDEGVAFTVEGEQQPKPTSVARSRPHAALTRRQLDIARLIADDLTNRQIAARLFLSERTVETHVTNILNKLGLNSRTQISRWIADLNGPGLTAAEKRP